MIADTGTSFKKQESVEDGRLVHGAPKDKTEKDGISVPILQYKSSRLDL